MENLGKLEKVPLRDVWKNEEYDFSLWLSKEDNLKELSKTIGIDIVLEERESNVGKYSVDIYGYQEDDEDKKIVIENQLEDTNHDHLGKLITYASGKNATTVIWIVKRARDEHRQAIDWLNSHTDENVDFFLLEIELWKIGNSVPAPKFNIVCMPNNWGKVQKTSNSLTNAKKLQLEFWQGLSEYGASNETYAKEFNKRKASAQHWYSIPVGTSDYHIDFTCNTQKNELAVEIYINDNKEVYSLFYNNKEKIEKETGLKFVWSKLENKKASRIKTNIKVDFNDKDKWNEYYEWLCEKAVLMKKIFNAVYIENN